MEVYTLFSGSSGNSIYIRGNKGSILIDAGVSCKRIEASLSSLGTSLKEIDGIYITHSHSDHTGGLITISKKYAIPLYMTLPTAKAICPNPESSPLTACIRTIDVSSVYITNDLYISPFKTPHDAPGSVGYRVEEEGNSAAIGVATDIGHVSREVFDGLSGCQTVIIESNHDVEMLRHGPYPPVLQDRVLGENGHLSNYDCSETLYLLAQKGARNICLFHISLDNNRPELALSEARKGLEKAGLSDTDYFLCTAPRYDTKRII